MNKKTSFAIIAMLVSATILVSGCSTADSNLIKKSNAGSARVMYAEMRPDTGGTVVQGRLVQTGARTLARNGHLDVQLIDASGKSVAKVCSDPIHKDYRGPGRGLKTKPFAVRVNAAAPGGKALVTYRPGHSCDI